jgi:hypothetical protein
MNNILYLLITEKLIDIPKDKNILHYNISQKIIIFDDITFILDDNKNPFFTILKYILFCNKYSYIYIINDCNISKYTIPSKNYDYYGNVIINKNIHNNEDFIHEYSTINDGYVLSIKSVKILIKNESLFPKKYTNKYDKLIGDILYQNNIYLNNITKNAVIFFHKNIKKLYKQKWIDQCIHSVLNQKNIEFDIIELNYGGDGDCLIENYTRGKHYFFNIPLTVHTDAMVFLLNKGFCELDYDIIFNTNLDDYYHEDRFYKQKKCVLDGYIMCSTLWHYIKEIDDVEKNDLVFTKQMLALNNSKNNYIDIDDIKEQLNKNHNVINHSAVCFTRKMWYSYDKNDNLLRYRDDKPFEDLTFWQRVVSGGHLITIIDEDLVFYRIHENQIGTQASNEKKNDDKDNLRDKDFKDKPNQDIKRIGIYLKLDNDNIDQFQEFIDNVNKNLLFDYDKYYFIITNLNEKIIKSYNIKYFIHKTYTINNNIYKYPLLFYPKIETLCEVLYYIDFEYIKNNTINIIPTKTNTFIMNDKFSTGITYYYLEHCRKYNYNT